MEVNEISVDTQKSLTLPWEEIILMPIGDIQVGSPECDKDRVKRDINWGLEHNAYFLGMGEVVDIMSPSNRKRFKSAGMYDSVNEAMEEICQQKVDEYLKLVDGTQGRWLGLLEGHHYWEFDDGTTTDTRVAQALKAPFLGTCAFVRVKLRDKTGHTVECTIWCHHGSGGGSKISSPLNKIENLMPYFDADIYLIGHQHKKVGAPIDQLYMTRQNPPKISYRTKLIACCGSYLRSYNQGGSSGRAWPRGGYVERWMLPPAALGCPLIFIRPVNDSRGRRVDINIGL